MSPDGARLATCVHEAISIVDVATSKVAFTLGGGGGGRTNDESGGDTEPVTALCWSKDGLRVFSASRSMRCTVWDATTGERVRSFKAHGMPVLHMTVDPSGSLLCTSSADRTARVWDVAKGFCTHAFRGHAAMVTVAAFHPALTKHGGRMELYTGAADGEIRAWSLKDRECVGSMHEHQSAVTALAVPVGAEGGMDKLLSAARDRVVHEWDLKTRKRAATVPVHEAVEGLVALDQASAAALIGAKQVRAKPRAVYFATAGEKGVVRVWRVGAAASIASGPSLRLLPSKGGHDDGEGGDDAAAGTFTSLHALPTADGLLAVTGDARLLFYGSGGARRPSGESSGESSDDETGRGGDGRIVIERELIGNNDEIISAAFLSSPELGAGGEEEVGETAAQSAKWPALVVATNSALLRVFDPSTMACAAALSGHSGAILCLDAAVGPNGEALVMTGSRDHTVRLWDMTAAAQAVADDNTASRRNGFTTAGARCIAVGEGHVGAVAAVALAKRQGAPVAISGGADKVARVWDVAAAVRAAAAARREAFVAAGLDPTNDDLDRSVDVAPVPLLAKAAAVAHDKAVNCAAVAPNLAMGATCSGDRTARLWRLPDLVPVGVLRGHKRGVWAVAFSPTDRVVATAGGDKLIKLWSVGDGNACLRTLEGHTAAVLALRFISRGTQVVSTGSDGLMVLWGVRTGAAVATMDAHEDKAWALAATADGDALATGGADAKLTLWTDTTAAAAEEEARDEALTAGARQALSNAAASGEHEKAARLALKLGHTHALLKAIKAMLADRTGAGTEALDALAGKVTGKALHRFVAAIREWNTNARHCDAAQRCLAALLRRRRLDELAAVPGMRDSSAALRAYTRRHFARAGRLLQGTYLLDVALAGMGVLLDDEEGASAGAGEAGGSRGEEDGEEPAGLVDQMLARWGAEAPSKAEVVAKGTTGGGGNLGAVAKAAKRAPMLTMEHIGGDDQDDFDLGDFSDEEEEEEEEEEVVDDDDEVDDEVEEEEEMDDEEEDDEDEEGDEEEDDEDDEESESESDEPEPEPEPKSKVRGSKTAVPAKKAPSAATSAAKAKPPPVTKPPRAPASTREKTAAAAAVISPRKTRRQRAESLSPAPSPPSSPPRVARKASTPAKSAAKRKAAAGKEPAAETPVRRSVRSRK